MHSRGDPIIVMRWWPSFAVEAVAVVMVVAVAMCGTCASATLSEHGHVTGHVRAEASPRSGCGACWCVVNSTAGGVCPSWQPSNYTAAAIALFRAVPAIHPPMQLVDGCNPYRNASCGTSPPLRNEGPTAVCALRYNGSAPCAGYELETFASSAAAASDGYTVTHTGNCGLCSTLADLATYMALPDMTISGKKCGVEAVLDMPLGIKCFKDLGLTAACAQIWAYDAVADAKPCGAICLKDAGQPYNIPPTCKLNDCLQCDEDHPGPTFKQFAARTRRRSGLLSAIQRPCDAVAQLVHHPCTPA
jgi:hypothetical protein